MVGCGFVIDEELDRRAQIVRILENLGLQPVVELDHYAAFDRAFMNKSSPRVGVVAVSAQENPVIAFFQRLRGSYPGCLILAVDGANTDDSAAHLFEVGAHDVLRTPLRVSELEVRMKHGLMSIATVSAKVQEYTEMIAKKFNLTGTEARILNALSARAGEVVSRDDLSRQIFGHPWIYGDRRFDVHVTNIRRKVAVDNNPPFQLKTIRNVGYVIERRKRAFDQ